MTTKQIDDIKRLLAEATPGPVAETAKVCTAPRDSQSYFATDDNYRSITAGAGYTPKGYEITGCIKPADAAILAAAVNALPSLLADIEMLREALKLISQRHPGYGGSGEIARKALADTEVKP